jgi:hypothetical protein
LILENLKGFPALDFDFSRPQGDYAGWTVITGENASGKTALLKAIALAVLGPDVARALQPSLEGWIRRSASLATIAVEIVADDSDRFAQGRRPEKPFWSELELRSNGTSITTLVPGNRLRGKKKGPIHGPWSETTDGWFAAGYGPFRRLYGASPDAQRLMSGPNRVARFATMFREDATLGECEIWLKDLHYKRLEQRARESGLLEAVLRILNAEFLRNNLVVDRIDSDGLWLTDGSGTVLPLADMSEGYRAAIAMLVDIIRHLTSVYGSDAVLGRASHILDFPGVVLIDEVDSHLHPEWQRQIGFWLKRHFPSMQFIVTTHSPLICQAADPSGLFHLPAPGADVPPFRLSDEDYCEVIKSKVDAIYLSPVFEMKHTRSPRAVAAREKFAQLEAKRKSAGLSAVEEGERRQLEFFVDD